MSFPWHLEQFYSSDHVTRLQGKLVLTGKLGDIIRESAQTALSWVRSHLSELYFSADTRSPQKIDFSAIDVHIHMPAGATPKDGRSNEVRVSVSGL